MMNQMFRSIVIARLAGYGAITGREWLAVSVRVRSFAPGGWR